MLTVSHAFVSAVADDPATPLLVQPQRDWNAQHVLTGVGSVAQGGTGIAAYTVGDLVYASGTTTLSKLAAVAVGRVLVSGGVGAAPAWSASPTLTGLTVTSTTGTTAIIGVNSGGGLAIQASIAAGNGIAVGAYSNSTTQPAVLGAATGYYAGLFFNVTDLGSTGANANCIGLVGQSVYSNAAYFQQGAVGGGVGSTLVRNNPYPALYVTRIADSLATFDFTAPLLSVEDTTAATGDLAVFIVAGSVERLRLTKGGMLTFGGTTVGSPALKRVGAALQVRTATDSTYADLTAATITAAAQLIAPSIRADAAGYIYFNSRSNLASPASGQLNLTVTADNAGVGLDFVTDAVLKVRTRAQSAYATLDCLGLKASGVAGASKAAGPVTSITVVNGIVTACT